MVQLKTNHLTASFLRPATHVMQRPAHYFETPALPLDFAQLYTPQKLASTVPAGSRLY
jgi:hypothetical protein